MAGESNPEEANEYAALGGDLDVLRELLADQQAVTDESFPGEQRNALARAEADLARAQHDAEFEAIVEHARQVERAYVECLRTVWETSRAQGRPGRTPQSVFPLDPVIMNLARLNSWIGLL